VEGLGVIMTIKLGKLSFMTTHDRTKGPEMRSTRCDLAVVLAIVAFVFSARSSIAADTLCFEGIVIDRRDTIQLIPYGKCHRLDYERVGAKCYQLDSTRTERLVVLVIWNSVVVDTFFSDGPLDCNLWRVSESREEQYDEYYDWHHKNHGDLPKDKWMRLVDVITCNDAIVFELPLFRDKE
jgi:hypothetical protein